MRRLTIALFLLGAAGCATTADYSGVRILGTAPKGPYTTLGVIVDDEICNQASAVPNSVAGDQFSDADNVELERPYALAALRKQAAKLGAQALFITRVRVHVTTGSGQMTRGVTRITFEAEAIRFPELAASPPAAAGARVPAIPIELRDIPVEVVHDAPPPEAETPAPALPPAATEGDRVTTLAAYAVSGKPLGGFGMGLRIRTDLFGQQVAAITIFEVLPDSPAEKGGLEPLTSILKIDGRPIQDFRGSLKKGSDLNRKLMHRNPGAKLTLEILRPGSTVPQTVTLTEGYPKPEFGSSHGGELGLGGTTVGR